MKRTNIHLTEEQLKLLRELADFTGLSVAEMIRRIIDEHLDRVYRRRKKRSK